MYKAMKPLVRICILGVLVSCLWLLPKDISRSQVNQSEKEVAVTVTQLAPQNGLVPVEVRCFSRRVIPKPIDGFSCNVKNNTTKNVLGITLNYSILLEDRNTGKTNSDTHTLTMNALIHPDFRETQKPISPGEEAPVSSPNIAYESSVLINAIEVITDYVEFDDGTSLGPNQYGSKVMAGLREGAAMYKDWLVSQYLKKEKSIPDTVSLLQSEQPLPSNIANLRFDKGNHVQGAKNYRILLRKLLEAKGTGELEKVLRK